MPAESPGARTAPGNGVIHDIGYRRYEGERLGRAEITTALAWHSLRSAFGLGRGPKAKVVPLLAVIIMCLPAVVGAVLVANNPARAPAISYDTYVPGLRILVMIVFLAAQAPELVSRDLRSRVLPLYFARPVTRLDYPLAKLAAFAIACLILMEVPLLVLYLGTVVQVHSGAAVWAQTRALIPGLGIGLLWSLLLAPIALAIAALSSRRAYASGSVAVFFLLTWTLAHLLAQMAIRTQSGRVPPAAAQIYALISPFTVLDGVRQWLGGTSAGVIGPPGNYGPVFGLMLLVFLGGSLALLAARYRRVDAT
jgi:ABC-2 type transport system permease protein